MTKNKMVARCVARNVKPTFEHDCTQCKFVGHVDGHDAYVCKTVGGSIVLRYGNEGPEYRSMPLECAPKHSVYALVVKLEQMYSEGLITRNKYFTTAIQPTFRPIRPQHLRADYN